MYLYRAINKHGKTLDFMLSMRRDKAAARPFSDVQLKRMAYLHELSSTKAEPIWLGYYT